MTARLGGALASILLAAALAAAPAHAGVRRAPDFLDKRVERAAVIVNYTEDPGPHAVDAQTANAVADEVERSLATFASWGFPPPMPDSDGKLDVFIYEYATDNRLGTARADYPSRAQSPGAFSLRPIGTSTPGVIAHELFHLVQYGLYRAEAKWVLESTAEWARFNALGYGTRLGYLRTPGVPLDCLGDRGSDACGGDPSGYARWPFWQSLSERHGREVVLDAFRRAAALGAQDLQPHMLEALEQVAAARGSTLRDELVALSGRLAVGRWALQGPAGVAARPAAVVQTGSESRELPRQPVVVDHLATAYVGFASGTEAEEQAPCRGATLLLGVRIPEGVAAQPLFVRSGADPVPLTVEADGIARGRVPWSTCSGLRGTVALQNPAAGLDAAAFEVVSGLSVGGSGAERPTGEPPKQASDVVPPAVTRLRAPRRVRYRAGRRPVVTVEVTVDRPGRVVPIVTRRPRFVPMDADNCLTTLCVALLRTRGDQAYLGPPNPPRVRKGRNRLRFKLPRGWRPGREVLALQPYALGPFREEIQGEIVSQAIRFVRR